MKSMLRMMVVIALFSVLIGCSPQDAPETSTQNNEPALADAWHEETPMGVVTGTFGKEEQFNLHADNTVFSVVLATVCDRFEITCSVNPDWLLRRGITIQIQANNLEEAMNQLCTVTGLENEQQSDSEWLLVLKGAEGKVSPPVRGID
ncbi:MAG: hypothetical protein AAF456_07685 [Planctomycetota bacterium]